MKTVIEVNHLVKRYGDLLAVDHLNLEIKEGEIYGLLGPNGSGKTTLINCILSLLSFEKGEVSIFGEKMSPQALKIKREIGVVPQQVAVFDELTVNENIDFFCGLYVKNTAERQKLVAEAIHFVGLEDFKKFRPKKLSGGLLRRLNIACGIAHKPKLIFLDEPTVAVDPQSRNRILEGIKQLNKEGSTVVYTTHYMEEVEELCDRVGIMDKGRFIAEGSTEEVKSMIGTKEIITVELLPEDLSKVPNFSELEGIKHASLDNNHLRLEIAQGNLDLLGFLNYLREHDVHYGQVFCEQPSLNNVFLEITGKELRDQ